MMNKFDHDFAQEYELTYAERWLQENGPSIWDAIHSLDRDQPALNSVILREFFNDDMSLWQDFVHENVNKAILDIGTGPVPAPILWPWNGKKYAIDPLSSQYDRICQKLFGRSWFDAIDARTSEAEILHTDLVGRIDGAIFCRNCLDHCREPYVILANISSYAVPGCALLLWTDLFHINGHDHGHTDITADRDGFRRVIEVMGFDIQREVPHVEDRGTIQFGCFAIKR